MVEPATHVGAVLGLELDDEVPLVRTIGAHPEVTLGHTYALSLDHEIVLDLGDHVESQSVEHAREDDFAMVIVDADDDLLRRHRWSTGLGTRGSGGLWHWS